VFDVTDSLGLENAERYIQHCGSHCSEYVVKILVGTKIDLAEKRCISKITAEEFAAKNGNIKYFEVSSKDCTNVESFVQIALSMLLEQEKEVKREVENKCAVNKNLQKSRLCEIL